MRTLRKAFAFFDDPGSFDFRNVFLGVVDETALDRAVNRQGVWRVAGDCEPALRTLPFVVRAHAATLNRLVVKLNPEQVPDTVSRLKVTQSAQPSSAHTAPKAPTNRTASTPGVPTAVGSVGTPGGNQILTVTVADPGDVLCSKMM